MNGFDLRTDARGVATLTLNRPEAHNALSLDLIDGLRAALAGLAGTPTVRAVVLAGAGASFCAGGDLTWMSGVLDLTRDQRKQGARTIGDLLRDLVRLPLPVVARVQGKAFGGGVGLAAACDVVIAADTAQFCLSEARLGVIPAVISPFVLTRVGSGFGRAATLTARIFGAEEALRAGLVGEVVAASGLDAAVERAVAGILACSPQALAHAKAMIVERQLGDLDDQLADSVERIADVWETEDAREGIAAFLQRRRPRWAAA